VKDFKLRDFILITIGIFLVAFSLEYFYIPAKIAAGACRCDNPCA